MSVENIYYSPVAGGAMLSRESASLVAGKGLEGDRNCKKIGTYSKLRTSKFRKGQQEPGRQLTLLSADSVEAALDRNGLPRVSLGDLRRNVVIRGIPAKDLLDAVGHVIEIGESCRLLVHRHCVPCMYNERKNEIPGLMLAIWEEAGVCVEVLQGGSIKQGDHVRIMMEETGIADDGNKPAWFYIPPNRRRKKAFKQDNARISQCQQKFSEIPTQSMGASAAA